MGPSRQQFRAKARAEAFREVTAKYGLEPRRARRRIALRWARERARQQLAALKGAATTALAIATLLGVGAVSALAQGSRKDDIVLNGRGQPSAGATIRVCTAAATGQPCTPLASIFSDQALTQALVNPTTTDGLGNYSFYAAPGRYMIEISGTGITTKQIPNVILPNDPSSPTFSSITTTSGISAFSLTLSGNLTVSGSAAVTGSLTVGGTAVPSTGAVNTWAADQYFTSGRPIYDVMGKGASGSSQNTTGTMSAGGTAITLAAAQDFKNTQGIAVYGAGPLSTLAAPTGLTVTPTNIVSTIVSPPVGVSRSANVVTITTTFPHYFQVGQSVTIAGTAGCATSPNGTFTVATVPTAITFTYAQTAVTETCGSGTVTIAAGATTYSYQVAAIDASGGMSAPAAAVSTTTGYAALGPSTFTRLTWNCVTNAVMYAVYGRSGSLVAQQVAGPCDKGATTKIADDLGNTLPVPTYVPNAVPTGATNQVLLTTVSAGGGTVTLTLAASATAAVTSATVQHDDTAAIQAAITAARAGGGTVYLPIGTHNFWNLDFRTFGTPQSWWVFKFDGILSPHIPIVLGSFVQFVGGTQMGGVNMFDNRTPYSLIQHNNVNPVVAMPGLTNPGWAGYFAISGHVGDGVRVSSKDPANTALNVTIDHAYIAANDAATGSPLRIDEGASGVGGFNYSVKGGTYRSGPTSMYPSIWATTTQDLHVQDDVVLVNSGPRIDGASFTTATNGKAVFRNILTESFKTPFLLLDGTGGVTAMITIDRLEMADNIFSNITLLENLGSTNINNITVTNSAGWNNSVTSYSQGIIGLRIFGDRNSSQMGPGFAFSNSFTLFDSTGNINAGGASGQQYNFNGTTSIGGTSYSTSVPGTHSGTETFADVTRIKFIDGTKYATTGAGVASAVSDLLALGGGEIRVPSGTVVNITSAPLVIGQTGSPVKNIKVTIEPGAQLSCNFNSSTTDCLQVGDSSEIDCLSSTSANNLSNAHIVAAANASVNTLVAPIAQNGTQESYKISNCTLAGNTTNSNIATAVINLSGMNDNTKAFNNVIIGYRTTTNAPGILIGPGVTGSTGAGQMQINGNWVDGGTANNAPCYTLTNTNGAFQQFVATIWMTGNECQNAGTAPAIQLTAGTTGQLRDIHVKGLLIGPGVNGAKLIDVNGCWACRFEDILASAGVANTTAVFFESTLNANAMNAVENVFLVGGNWANAITDATSGYNSGQCSSCKFSYSQTGPSTVQADLTSSGLISATGFRTSFSTNATAARSISWPDAGGNGVLDTATQTLTNKTLTSPILSTGVNNNGSGFKHSRVASCTTAAAAGSTCTTTITWTTAFADANYTATCTIDNPTGVPYVLNTGSKLGASVVVTIANLTAVAASGSLNCVGAHD